MSRPRNLNLDSNSGTDEENVDKAPAPQPELVRKKSTPRDEKPSLGGEAYSSLFNCAARNLSGASTMYSNCGVELDLYLKEVDKKAAGPKQ